MVQGGEVDWLAEGPGEAAGPAVSPQREAAAVRSRRGRGQARAPVFGRAGGVLSALRSPSEPPGESCGFRYQLSAASPRGPPLAQVFLVKTVLSMY